ncbi:MAG: phosphoribosylformylglycinamidine synthase subunit PurL [Candidatus Omnitrophica bacterium]|nr:phosphoribosylformylglycinamidine synthase subunit PurL [Candidatus Omnitrophota bacterium]
MIWRIEIKHKSGIVDPLAGAVLKTAVELGVRPVEAVETVGVFLIQGELSADAARRIGRELLTDPVTQECVCSVDGKRHAAASGKKHRVAEIAYHPGVMDPVEQSTMKGIRDLGYAQVEAVRTARRYFLFGDISDKELDVIVNKVLANKLIQQVVPEDFKMISLTAGAPLKDFRLAHIDLLNADDRELTALSGRGHLFLNLTEMRAIRAHFKNLGRDPTDCELETIAQTWSEHCFHKTFRGDINFAWKVNGKVRRKKIKNLLKSTIVRATQTINKSWCVSVFHDNAGVIEFDDDMNVCFKVETHNHPSALEPFGGANTGVGGVIRDILGTGLGAKPVCSTDVFCFAPPETDFASLPAGTLHPKRVMKGVVSGVRDYGNKMGIPTVNGAICFDPLYLGNPLVYCGTVGILPKDKVFKKVGAGDCVVVVGGRTGRDGIHGATFSSGELTAESETVSSGAVQIGDPIQEKKVLDGLLKARDMNLYTAVTDCGAGGLSSAVGEMGQELGARIDLDLVPLKYQGLNYEEIWISESQERMVLSVPRRHVKRLVEVFAGENVEAAVIGEFSGNGRLELFFQGRAVCVLDMKFLHTGHPKMTKEAVWALPKCKEPKLPPKPDLNQALVKALAHLNVCSKEWVVRQYDHEVQGGSVVKPFCGPACDGPSDAAVITPRLGSYQGIAIANGIHPAYGKIDPYAMAASCVDEALRQVVAVGGDPQRTALLDNFCWGNPDKPERLGGLVRCAQGCADTAIGYGAPFISGKDSLYNEYGQGNQTIAIPGTILISAIGIVPDVRRTVTMDLKAAGNLLYVVGMTRDEMGGSIYFDTLGVLGSSVPGVAAKLGVKIFAVLHQAMQTGLVRSCHDCSDGGLAVALAEMAFAGGMGVSARLERVPYQGAGRREDFILFSESNTRFVVEIEPEQQRAFETILRGLPYGLVGRVEAEARLAVYGFKDTALINSNIRDLKEAWQKPLRW